MDIDSVCLFYYVFCVPCVPCVPLRALACSCDLSELILHHTGELRSLRNPILNLFLGGELADKGFCFVNFHHFLVQIISFASGKFDYGVNTGCLKQLCILATNALNPGEIGMVCPCKDLLLRDSGFFGKLCSTLFRSAGFQQRFHRFYTDSIQLLLVSFADSFNNTEFCHTIRSFQNADIRIWKGF